MQWPAPDAWARARRLDRPARGGKMLAAPGTRGRVAGHRGRVARPGRLTYPQRELWLRLRRFARVNARLLVVFTLLEGAAVASFAIVLDGYFLGLLQGLALSALAASIWLIFLMATPGAQAHLAGCWGESCTRDVLRGGRRRGSILGWVDNLETAGGDVDHLVVTSSGVLAIDSKWRGRRLSPHMLEADVHAASSSARRASLILRSLGHPADVTPVVVVWGGGRELLGRRRVIQGVHVVAGPHLRGWLRDQARGDAAPLPDAPAMLGDLRAFRQRVCPPRREDPARAV